MSIVCTQCWKRIISECGCDSQQIEVDELIIPVLQILNGNGLKTVFSCSGHFDEEWDEGYVVFQPYVMISLTDSLNIEDHSFIDGLSEAMFFDDKQARDMIKLLSTITNLDDIIEYFENSGILDSRHGILTYMENKGGLRFVIRGRNDVDIASWTRTSSRKVEMYKRCLMNNIDFIDIIEGMPKLTIIKHQT